MAPGAVRAHGEGAPAARPRRQGEGPVRAQVSGVPASRCRGDGSRDTRARLGGRAAAQGAAPRERGGDGHPRAQGGAGFGKKSARRQPAGSFPGRRARGGVRVPARRADVRRRLRARRRRVAGRGERRDVFPRVRAVQGGRARAAGDALAVRLVFARGAPGGGVAAAPVSREVPRAARRAGFGKRRRFASHGRRARRGGPPLSRAQARVRRAAASAARALPRRGGVGARFSEVGGGRRRRRLVGAADRTFKERQRVSARLAEARASSEDARAAGRRGPHPAVRAEAAGRRARGGRRVALRLCRRARLGAALLRVFVAGAHQQQRAQRASVPGARRQQSGLHGVPASVRVREESRRRPVVRARKRRRALSGTRARHRTRRAGARRRGARPRPARRRRGERVRGGVAGRDASAALRARASGVRGARVDRGGGAQRAAARRRQRAAARRAAARGNRRRAVFRARGGRRRRRASRARIP